MTNLEFLMIREDVVNSAFAIQRAKNNIYKLSDDFINEHRNRDKTLDNWFYFFEYKKSNIAEPKTAITNYSAKAKSLVKKWEDLEWITSGVKTAIYSQIDRLKQEDEFTFYEWLLFHEDLILAEQTESAKRPLFKQSSEEGFNFIPFVIMIQISHSIQ